MTIAAVSALNTVSSASTSSTSSSNGGQTTAAISSSLNLDFTQYLQILTAQLQNQDPTDPTDPSQFTQELIQIEQVEEQNNTNSDLESLTNATSANGLATGVGYIGNYVQANSGSSTSSSSGQFSLENGSAEFGYTLAGAATNVTITVQDSNGDTVATLNGSTSSGGNYVTWNGENGSGEQEADGAYTFTISATDGSDNAVTVSDPVSIFKVTSVQSGSDGTLELLAGALSLSSSDVTDVYTASTLPSATAASAQQSGS